MDPGGYGGTGAAGMEGGPGAFGGGKAGAAQDPISFVQRPAVIIRVCSLVRKRKIIILLHTYILWWCAHPVSTARPFRPFSRDTGMK